MYGTSDAQGRRTFPSLLVASLLWSLVNTVSPATAQDCNNNGIPDAKDVIPRDFGFSPFESYRADKGVIAVTTRDDLGNPLFLNADDLPDLLVASRNTGTVASLINIGKGAFADPISHHVGQFPQSLAVADFDRNGVLDVASANLYGESVSVLIGLGNGHFENQIEYDMGYRAKAVVAADFNDDDYPDLAVTLWTAPRLERLLILLNQGDGSFEFGEAYLANGSPTAVAASDLNRDGHVDLVVAGTNITPGSIMVYMGAGGGHFSSPVEYLMAPRWITTAPTGLAIADLDNDGDPDIAVSNWWDSTTGWGDVRLFENNGDGTFLPVLRLSTEGHAEDVEAVDLDFDGDLDLVLAQNGPQTATVLINHGYLQFSEAVQYFVGPIPRSITTGDFDGDGTMDLATANITYTDYVAVMLGETTGPAYSHDCNFNDVPDECDIAGGTSLDCNDNGYPDECETTCGFIQWRDEPCTRHDCNGNEIPDDCDLADHTSHDYNNNNLPDECDPCFGDFNRNGERDEIDLMVIEGVLGCPVEDGNWPCVEADIDNDGQVNAVDLGLLQALLGACPNGEEP